MKLTLLPCLLLLVVLSCRDKTSPDPVTAKPVWTSVPGVSKSPLILIDATPANLLVQNHIGFQRIDATNTITGSFDLTDTTTADYPICSNDQFTVVYSYRYKAKLEPILSIYDYSRSQQPLLSVPISQVLRPRTDPGHLRNCNAYYCEDEVWLNSNYYRSGILDNDGNLFLGFVSQGYTTADYYYHYYKLKVTIGAQNKLTLQVANDYFYKIYNPNSGQGVTATLFSFTNQSFIRYSSGTSSQLVKINPQGTDQTILTASYRIDNVFKINNVLYVVASTSELWATTDSGTNWQLVKTLTPVEKAFFTNCSTNNGDLPLLSIANNTLLRRTDLNAKTDSLIAPASPVYSLLHINQRYYVWAKDGLYYSDSPPVLPHH